MPDNIDNIVYNRIGEGYDLSRKADPFITGRLIHFLRAKQNGRYLDIGCGTGNYTIAIASNGIQMIGIDPSANMLSIAKIKAGNLIWMEGNSESIPLQDSSVHGVIATLTIHHWKNLSKSFDELYRVCDDKSQLVIFTSSPDQMESYWLNHYFPGMMKKSIDQMPQPDDVVQCATNAGFKLKTTELYVVKPDLEDHFLYAGKYNPAFYLDEQKRKRISSFSALCDHTELKAGSTRLENDIKSGVIKDVIKRFENSKGDYLFLNFEK